MPADELAATLAKDKRELDDAQAAHDALMKELQEKYQASEENLKELKEEKQPKIKLMKAATRSAPPADPRTRFNSAGQRLAPLAEHQRSNKNRAHKSRNVRRC